MLRKEKETWSFWKVLVFFLKKKYIYMYVCMYIYIYMKVFKNITFKKYHMRGRRKSSFPGGQWR